ncbi:UDP-Glc:alpha-D-GlcNAc-diphosphoundecaprenol beta-1,3-glucosyltransferase WfgD [Peribacillus sp. Bi96]|uniref:glycosyltransferase family 2 protein n=1 Tax=unclassified Peribacillus TaxID=2675266 RepID=UPI001D9000B7|nr:glycosyltransferase [Peribacillus sp. Bi96]CAH0148717.1 UDP-Glc:alpha-D-GlcNAc-diphosphoundecaprenol beta-1,3-glucosyltransferase WfgD [Peribacillus sp. Bi96]
MSKVSIVVPFYNCPYIDKALESLINQTYKNIEIIVVDDGSTLYAEKIEPYLDEILYIKKENGGTASALNTGIKNATGDYLCWLSSDDIFYPEKTEVQLDVMKRNIAQFSYTSYYCINENGEIITPIIGIDPPNQLELIKAMIRGNIINGCSVMIQRKVFDLIGVFDEKLLYTHDYDLWLRVMQNFKLCFVPQPLLLYRIHTQMGSIRHEGSVKMENRLVINRHHAKMKQLLVNELRKQ